MKGKIVLFAMALAALTSEVSAAKLDKGAYRAILARNCHLQSSDASQQFFKHDLVMKEKTIHIRHIQKGWKGWLRIHAVGQVTNSTAWGYADIQPLTGEIICDPENWNVGSGSFN